MNVNGIFSHNSDEWSSPHDLVEKLNNIYHFTLDPCANYLNNQVDFYFTKDDDGLSKSWKGFNVYCNPPYSDITNWIIKAIYEYEHNNVHTVMLVPARTDTRWFHNYIYHKNDIDFEFIKGRLKFGNSKNSAPFPSMLIFFGGKKNEN